MADEVAAAVIGVAVAVGVVAAAVVRRGQRNPVTSDL
jgi:hypothetical protein